MRAPASGPVMVLADGPGGAGAGDPGCVVGGSSARGDVCRMYAESSQPPGLVLPRWTGIRRQALQSGSSGHHPDASAPARGDWGSGTSAGRTGDGDALLTCAVRHVRDGCSLERTRALR